jgi:hypothetical protein
MVLLAFFAGGGNRLSVSPAVQPHVVVGWDQTRILGPQAAIFSGIEDERTLVGAVNFEIGDAAHKDVVIAAVMYCVGLARKVREPSRQERATISSAPVRDPGPFVSIASRKAV